MRYVFLANCGKQTPLGCVALRAMDSPGICEMKRLYVAPEGRDSGLGKKLVGIVLTEAKRIGYQTMRLDTLPRMQSAVALYEKFGFVKIESYYETPLEGTLFLEIDLRNWRG
jgi:ribosomal protein S18 acetylase RimI-like enzyme